MTTLSFIILLIIFTSVLAAAAELKSMKEIRHENHTNESISTISDATSAIEEIYTLAQRTPELLPTSIIIYPRRISENYLTCSIKLVTWLSQDNFSIAENISNKGIFYWQAELENNGTVALKYYCPHEIKNFKSFENILRKELRKKHPDWKFSSDGMGIFIK